LTRFSLGLRASAQGYRLQAFDEVGSTNAEALTLARSGEQGPIWLVTDQQSAGRGRRNRAWSSPKGNLACSVLEMLPVAAPVAATLGFAAGLALEAALDRISVETRLRAGGTDILQFRLKWPNDVLAGGYKLSGILLEADASAPDRLALVVGIGVNVVAAPEGLPYPATSLRDVGLNTSAEDLFSVLSDAWSEFRGIWNLGKGFGDIRRLWLERAHGVGERVSINTGSATVEGIFDTIDENGCMIVMTTDNRRVPVAAGDVYFGTARSAGAA
jgi:BirA family biotin operon repressor/biotin-[acetyl-CoA-carboxylase] ligase